MTRTITQDNIILATDSYKVSHHKQYPKKMTFMSDYFESRGGVHDRVMFFGLQYYLLHYLQRRITIADVDEAYEITKDHFGTDEYFPREGWERVVYKHKGRIPLRIRAVPEGRLYTTKTPLFVVESMDEELPWLVSWFEGLLQKVWYPTTIATLDFHTKLQMFARLLKTSDNPMAGLAFMLHCFGYRGVSSEESAKIGGAATLVNFMGTDTLPALLLLRDYYGAVKVAGHSVAASEHSTTTTWGRSGEGACYRNLIEEFGKHTIVSMVVDSYDPIHAVSVLIGEDLKAEVLAMKATLVVRPDSGDPVEMVTTLVKILDEKFGSTVNSLGYKVLNKARVLQGDGIDHSGAIPEILDAVIALGYSAENIVFGMGGGRLQIMNRDTQKFAIKCSLAVIDGVEVEVYKDPITDPGKRSHRGRVDVIEGFFHPIALDQQKAQRPDSMLGLVFEYGDVTAETTLDLVRERAAREFETATALWAA